MTTETEEKGDMTQTMLWLGGALIVVVALAYFAM